MKRKRVRVKLIPPCIRNKITKIKRTDDYYRLRFWWLHELRQLRAKRRNGTATIKDVKAAQRVLKKVRRDEYV